jgi:hypothetical protein
VSIQNLDVYFENAPCVFQGATLTATSSSFAPILHLNPQELSALQVVEGGHASLTGCRLLG